MIKYYDADVTSNNVDNAQLYDVYTYKYSTNYNADNRGYREIVEDRYTTKPRNRSTNRTKNGKIKRNDKVYNKKVVENRSHISSKDEIRKRVIERKKNINRICYVVVCFAMLMLISYRYATINANFRQKENLKKELASIQKENEQLKVNIEKQMNFNAIEQEAKEKLGMQKLDNNQKVYVNLNKSDYIEPSESVSNTENQKEETWWCKLLKDLFKIDN